MIADHENEVKYVEIVADRAAFVFYEHEVGHVRPPEHASIMIPIWTTALARLTLYRYIDQCVQGGATVLYYDTGMLSKNDNY